MALRNRSRESAICGGPGHARKCCFEEARSTSPIRRTGRRFAAMVAHPPRHYLVFWFCSQIKPGPDVKKDGHNLKIIDPWRCERCERCEECRAPQPTHLNATFPHELVERGVSLKKAGCAGRGDHYSQLPAPATLHATGPASIY